MIHIVGRSFTSLKEGRRKHEKENDPCNIMFCQPSGSFACRMRLHRQLIRQRSVRYHGSRQYGCLNRIGIDFQHRS